MCPTEFTPEVRADSFAKDRACESGVKAGRAHGQAKACIVAPATLTVSAVCVPQNGAKASRPAAGRFAVVGMAGCGKLASPARVHRSGPGLGRKPWARLAEIQWCRCSCRLRRALIYLCGDLLLLGARLCCVKLRAGTS